MKKKIRSKSIRLIKQVLRKSILLIFTIFFFILCISLLGLVTPIVYQKIIDSVIPNRRIDLLFIYLAILVSVPCLNVLMSSFKNYFSALLGDKITQKLRKECLQACLHAKFYVYETFKPNDLIYNFTREIGKIGEIYITKDILTFCTEFISLLAILVTMFLYNKQLTLLCVVAFPVLLITSNIISKKCQSVEWELTSTLNEGQTLLSQIFSHIKRIKISNGYKFETNRWENWLFKYQKVRLKSSISNNFNRFLLSELITGIIYGLIFFVGSIQVIKGTMNLGALITFIAFVPKVYSSLKNILNIRVSSAVIRNSITKIDEILNSPQESYKDVKIRSNVKSIKLLNVNFNYNLNNFGIHDISINASSNQIIGLIGPTGSGKSTIFDLLTKIYDVHSGTITINDYNVEDLNTNALRNKIAMVTQECELFNASIKSNILYPDLNYNIEDVSNIIDILQLKNLVERLPNGLETNVGENGMLLSGGERQRILLANALLKNADIILLDEFTSALDVETERKINDYIFGLKNKIIITITHRTYMVRKFDYIYFIENGEIIEQGNPLLLLSNENSYLYKFDKNTDYLS